MQRNKIKVIGTLAAVTAAFFLAPASPLSAQVDMTGTWALEVDGAVSNPELVLEQNGMAITGRYTSAQLGEADVTGTVEGNSVTVSFEVDFGGQLLPGEYAGTVDANGVWTGTLDLAGLAGGSFTATKR